MTEKEEKEYIKTLTILARQSDELFKTAIETILDLYKKEKEKNKELEEKDIASSKVIVEQCDYIQNKSISIEKIIELINKIDNKANRAAGTYQYSASNEDLENKKTQVRYYDHFIKELQELLEGDN